MSGASAAMSTENSRTRFSCSERTPRMKKLPRPTVSRTRRTWLPGRVSCSTAWRSANQPLSRAAGSMRSAATPARCSTSAVAARPTATTSPMRTEPACHTVSSDQRGGHQAIVTHLHASRTGAAVVSSRSSRDGFTWRTSSSGTSANSSDTSSPIPSALQDRRRRQRVVDGHPGGRRGQPARRDQRPWRRRRAATPERRCRPGPSTSTCAR